MTHAAKLAWAEQVGVTPPAYVMAAAAHDAEEHEPGDHDSSELASGGCCSSKAKNCCSEAKSCCSAKAHDVAAAPTAAAERGVKVVLLISAMKCRGLSVSIGLLPPSLPVASAEFVAPPLARFAPNRVESLLYESPSHQVDYPPPDAART